MTDETSQDDNDLVTDEVAPATLLSLPDELAEWAEQNKEMVLRIHHALSDTYNTLTEEQLWEVIAAAASPEWRTAREELAAAEEQWADLNSPENASLGAIGNALDSEETADVGKNFAVALSDFTIIDEGLRQRADLRKLLQVLLVQRRMLALSGEVTQQVQRDTNALKTMIQIRNDFREAARKRIRITAHFQTYARRLFQPKKEAALRTAPVLPWAPKT